MEGNRHTHPLILCLWQNKLCGSQPHMQTWWLHFSVHTLSWGKEKWGTGGM